MNNCNDTCAMHPMGSHCVDCKHYMEKTSGLIESNEKLFNEVKSIGENVKDLGYIIQNTMPFNEKELLEWDADVRNKIQALKDWRIKVHQYVRKPFIKLED